MTPLLKVTAQPCFSEFRYDAQRVDHLFAFGSQFASLAGPGANESDKRELWMCFHDDMTAGVFHDRIFHLSFIHSHFTLQSLILAGRHAGRHMLLPTTTLSDMRLDCMTRREDSKSKGGQGEEGRNE